MLFMNLIVFKEMHFVDYDENARDVCKSLQKSCLHLSCRLTSSIIYIGKVFKRIAFEQLQNYFCDIKQKSAMSIPGNFTTF